MDMMLLREGSARISRSFTSHQPYYTQSISKVGVISTISAGWCNGSMSGQSSASKVAQGLPAGGESRFPSGAPAELKLLKILVRIQIQPWYPFSGYFPWAGVLQECPCRIALVVLILYIKWSQRVDRLLAGIQV